MPIADPPNNLAFDFLMQVGDAKLAVRDLQGAERTFWQAHAIVHHLPRLHVRTHRRLLAIAYRRRQWRSVSSHIVSIAILSFTGLATR